MTNCRCHPGRFRQAEDRAGLGLMKRLHFPSRQSKNGVQLRPQLIENTQKATLDNTTRCNNIKYRMARKWSCTASLRITERNIQNIETKSGRVPANRQPPLIKRQLPAHVGQGAAFVIYERDYLLIIAARLAFWFEGNGATLPPKLSYFNWSRFTPHETR